MDNKKVESGFYGADVRSPQAVEFMKGTDCSYLQKGLQREFAAHDALDMFDGPERKMTNFERFQGSGTFCMDEDK